jgi:hypothetical protein
VTARITIFTSNCKWSWTSQRNACHIKWIIFPIVIKRILVYHFFIKIFLFSFLEQRRLNDLKCRLIFKICFLGILHIFVKKGVFIKTFFLRFIFSLNQGRGVIEQYMVVKKKNVKKTYPSK